jgi:hypothetical protein
MFPHAMAGAVPIPTPIAIAVAVAVKRRAGRLAVERRTLSG